MLVKFIRHKTINKIRITNVDTENFNNGYNMIFMKMLKIILLPTTII